MRVRITLRILAGILSCLLVPLSALGQSDAAKVYKTNCELCHGPNGSGDTGPGKAFHAKDLRSDEVQKQSDEDLKAVIAKGRGKMPAFGAKMKPEAITGLVTYIRSLSAKK